MEGKEQGFIGINIEAVKRELTKFDMRCNNTRDKIGNAFIHFFGTLYEKWASPNAQFYTTKVISEFEEEFNKFYNEFRHILSGAEAAAQRLAIANGQSMESHYAVPAGSTTNYSFQVNNNLFPCREAINGVTGMDTQAVKIALEVFRMQAREAINSFEEIPDGIAFYDPNGDLLQVYSRNVNSFTISFTDIFEKIIEDMSKYIQEEHDNILLAKDKAQETISA